MRAGASFRLGAGLIAAPLLPPRLAPRRPAAARLDFHWELGNQERFVIIIIITIVVIIIVVVVIMVIMQRSFVLTFKLVL